MTTEHDVHDWQPNPTGSGITAWICAECPETCATCGTCNRPSDTTLLLCEPCRREAARVLDDIAHALSLWEPEPRSLVKSAGNMALVPVPSSSGGGTQTADGIEGELWRWVGRWTEYTTPENTGWLGFLSGHLIWAAHHPAQSSWLEFLSHTRRLRTAARRVAGLLPRFMPQPCAHCGGPVVQDRADHHWNPLTGQLPDTVRCMRCGRAWDDPILYAFSNRQHIVEAPDEHPDAWVTLEQARMIWRDIPAATMRTWVLRSRETFAWGIDKAQEWWNAQPEIGPTTEPPTVVCWLPSIESIDGPRYRLGDLALHADRRKDDTRTGPKVAQVDAQTVA